MSSLFAKNADALIGMIHVGALPGTPSSQQTLETLIDKATREARILTQAGFDALLIENMHDRPYLKREAVGPEIVAAMAVLVREVGRTTDCPLGVQILAGANRQALAAALAGGAAFIRAEASVFGHVADEGWMESDAGDLLRFRRTIGAEAIRVLFDIRKKHASHAVTADLSLDEIADGALFFQADGVIVTGSATGKPASPEDVREVAAACPEQPVWIGSGVNETNVRDYLDGADGVIVGSSLKASGRWEGELDGDRARRFVDCARSGA